MPTEPTEAASAELRAQGYTVLRGAYDPEAVRERVVQLCGAADYDTLAAAFDDEDLALGGSRTNFRLTTPVAGRLLSAPLEKLFAALNPRSGARWYDASLITALPDMGRQPAHRDYSRPARRSGSWKVVVFTPLADVSRVGGVTVVYPCTQHEDTDELRGTKRVRLDRGDALVFLSSLKHYGAANSTDAPRILLSQTFEIDRLYADE